MIYPLLNSEPINIKIDKNLNLAPIVLFVYNRPWHTEQTLNALMQNELADQSVLNIYADGPKENATEEQLKKIDEVRQVIRKKKWCKEVHIVEADRNKGLADSVIDGVTEIVNKYGKIIVLEDDIVSSQGFLRYMNEALNLYANEDKVMEISGFMFPVNTKSLPDTFFYNVNSCWGWGTWKRAWKFYNNDALDLYLNLIESKVDWKKFNAYQGNSFKEQLLANVEKKLNTWAVKWHASMFLSDGNVLHPKLSLVKNIGMDGSGTNYTESISNHETILAKSIQVKKIPVQENAFLNDVLKNYFQNPTHAGNLILPSYISPISQLLKKVIAKLGNLKKFKKPGLVAVNELISTDESVSYTHLTLPTNREV